MSDTPETDAAYKNHPWDMHDHIPLEFCRKLERERDVARFDLAFRRELYVVQELKLSESRKTIAELQNTIRVLRDDADVIVEDRDYWRAEAKRWQKIKSEP